MKKILLVLLLLLCYTSTANAETMYLTEQSWSYSSPKPIPDIAVSVYGEGESVEVLNTEAAMKPVWVKEFRSYMYKDERVEMCSVEKNGVRSYIPRSALTAKKPKYTYRVKNCYRKITIDKGRILYSSPTFSSYSLSLENELEFYTLGQTNYWYEIYYKGKIYFINKKSTDIIDNEQSIFPTIKIDGVSEECVDRVKYMYSLLPQHIRNNMYIDSITISDWADRKDNIAGYMYMDRGIIVLREDKNTVLEHSLIHELGHAYFWKYRVLSDDVYEERHDLQIPAYYLELKEFYAEGLDLYVRRYEYLQEQAPGLFNYYDVAMH